MYLSLYISLSIYIYTHVHIHMRPIQFSEQSRGLLSSPASAGGLSGWGGLSGPSLMPSSTPVALARRYDASHVAVRIEPSSRDTLGDLAVLGSIGS